MEQIEKITIAVDRLAAYEDTGLDPEEYKRHADAIKKLDIEHYLDFMEIIPQNEEERFQVELSYFHIVNRLLLWETSHSGGTSTREKCDELGFDSSDCVTFEDERYKQGEET